MTLNSFHGQVIYGVAFYSPRYLLVKLHHMLSKALLSGNNELH